MAFELSLLQAFFLLLQDYYFSGVVINNDFGVHVACLQLHAPLILVSLSEQA